MTRPLPHIAGMQAYALAQITPPPGKPLVSLSQNESLRPPSPKAMAAAAQALSQGALYPDPDWTELRHALATRHRIPADGIICGSGSLDLIGALARVFAGPGRAVLAPEHAYPFFRTAACLADARFDTAAEEACTVSVDALLAAVRPDTALVFVANPGNPTGTRLPRSELMRLRKGLPGDVILVVDEAYGEFADHFDGTPRGPSDGTPRGPSDGLLDGSCLGLVADGATVVLRTFSKAYGMAGFRVGWGLFPPLIAAELRKVLNPNAVSHVAQSAAVAAVEDHAYMRETCALTAAARDTASARLTAAGLQVLPAFTNFVLIDLGTTARAVGADAALRQEGIFLRAQGGAGLPHALRLTIGPEAAMQAALARLERWTRETPS